MSTIINATTTNGVVIQPDNSGSLQLATNSGTTAVTIDTSQNVGIGTTSPTSKLDVNGGILSRGFGGEGGEINFNNPDNASVGMIVDVAGADTGRIFQVRNNSTLQLGQLVGTGGIIGLYTSAAERMRIDDSGNLLFNSGYGSVATAYGCRAWVNFNGTGTVAIRASGNVTSITDLGTGSYRVNFTTAITDANYSVNVTRSRSDYNSKTSVLDTGVLTTSVTVYSSIGTTTTLEDALHMFVSVFR